MWDYFKMTFFPYDLRKGDTLQLSPTHSRGSLLWNNRPGEIKESLSTEEFKKRLKEHEALSYSCVVSR